MTNKKEKKHSEYYYDKDRNLEPECSSWETSTTLDRGEGLVIEEEEVSDKSESKKDLKAYVKNLEEYVDEMEGYLMQEIDSCEKTCKQDERVPDYYRGKNGYEARKVCDNFDLNYHLGTAVTYIIRANKKHSTPVDCIRKAIAHLEFELEKNKKC